MGNKSYEEVWRLYTWNNEDYTSGIILVVEKVKLIFKFFKMFFISKQKLYFAQNYCDY